MERITNLHGETSIRNCIWSERKRSDRKLQASGPVEGVLSYFGTLTFLKAKGDVLFLLLDLTSCLQVNKLVRLQMTVLFVPFQALNEVTSMYG